jgi:chemosensory pili system protein ChpA (sensor histidine kinase/response regulator)
MTGPKILIIEPDVLQRDLMQLALQRKGYEVICGDVSDIRHLLKTHRPLVLALDIFLPRMNGLEVIKQLRAESQLIGVKVLAISSMAFKEIVQQAAQLGVDDFLIKPFDVEEMINHFQRILNDKM